MKIKQDEWVQYLEVIPDKERLIWIKLPNNDLIMSFFGLDISNNEEGWWGVKLENGTLTATTEKAIPDNFFQFKWQYAD